MVKAKNEKYATGSLLMTVGRNVKARREGAGMTQGQLAHILDVEVETVSRYERGAMAPSFQQLEKICAALQMSAWSLFSDGSEVPRADGGTVLGSLDDLSARDREFLLSFIQRYVEHHRMKK